MDARPGMQDVLGQLPLLKAYTHLLLCFPFPNHFDRHRTINALQIAIHRMILAFPWLGDCVLHHGVTAASSGMFTTAPHRGPVVPEILVVKDHSEMLPTYQDIVSTKGAISSFDGTVLSPRNAFPQSYDESEAPVLQFQVTWIQGGLLLDCAAQHNMLDMTGIGQVFRLLAICLCGDQFAPATIESGNQDRSTIFPLLGPDEPRHDHSHMRCLPVSQRPPPQPPKGPPSQWTYFRFNESTLATLKAASQSESSSPSTDDALSAFIWRSIGRVRLSRGQQPDTTARFCRAIDCRQALGVSKEYLGDVVTNAHTSMTFHELTTSSLSVVASRMRENIQKIGRNSQYIRSFATLIAEEPDKSTISYVGTFNPDHDIGSSSWARLDLYSVSFGGLGKPALIRRPDFVPVRGLIYFMPKTEDGDIDALVCLNEGELHDLKSDVEWSQYAEWIG
ncbi:uncharacterized protein EURHEDRAFT_464384 [Aspergillus ruber CBS 135680]|uniref:Trichothecene 3-O-acetyltransferase n=1 Tax=Aspergillus ruber (strain CBS 135680) TaxID=1388766 RepID=A0A017S4D1_ASPRC|nr:uncharacterized protein EURHEDRAFT_464384 [Aspergillus ruber CBS 135680]EYE91686.1 hypothetical protein EURHEDRAFT_464384 [Aspergillus ruber CBS 135680]